VRTVGLFARRRDVAAVVVAAPVPHLLRTRRLLAAAGYDRVVVVRGGKERQDSVWNGLQALPDSCEYVLVHDAVRPFASPALISSVVREARACGAAAAALPVGDTLRREGRRGFLSSTVDRSGLWAVQTPQGFRTEILRAAHREAPTTGARKTDETSLVEILGVEVRVVPGDPSNIKITSRRDADFARYLASKRSDN
jgi:2-C-methyl-D-erythritol 4-phosphate cytidylyltransferase